MTEAEILERIRFVESRLSPEYLSCDGELGRAAIRRRAAALNKERKELVEKLGREPSIGELYPKKNPTVSGSLRALVDLAKAYGW